MMDELLRREWLEEAPDAPNGHRVYLRHSEVGTAALADRGVDISPSKARKPVAFACTDWTERRWHLGGALGRAIVDALSDAGCIEQTAGSRVVKLTGGLERWLDL